MQSTHFSYDMKQLHLHNTLTESLQPFTPDNPHDVKLYCSGPTLCNGPHLGQIRTYVFMDVLRRILHHYLGYDVRLVMNMTDLHDPRITNIGLAQKFQKEFLKTLLWLNIQKAHFTPRVTECLELTTNIWKQCMTEKFAYFTHNFDVYFHMKGYLEKYGHSFPDTVQRDVAQSEEGKWNPSDFKMWNDKKEWVDSGGTKHIGIPSRSTACAATAIYHFQDSVDIYLGGNDLKFPRHEYEMAISRVYFGKKDWVRFCVHTGILEIGGEKMSNRLKNVVTVEEMLAKGYSPLAIRYMFLKHPYLQPMCFKEKYLKDAQYSYNRLMKLIETIKFHQNQLAFHTTFEVLQESWERCDELTKLKGTVEAVLLNNVDIPKALELVEDYVNMFLIKFTKKMSYEWITYSLQYVLFLVDTIFGLIKYPSESVESDLVYPAFKKFRSGVRDWAMKQEDAMQRNTLLEMCDKAKEEINQFGYTFQDEN